MSESNLRVLPGKSTCNPDSPAPVGVSDPELRVPMGKQVLEYFRGPETGVGMERKMAFLWAEGLPAN